MSVGLFNPLALMGLVALALPVLIHLARREPREGHRFPSLMFLRQLPVQVRRRRTLRHRALLALRCLAVALMVTAFAAPYLQDDDGDAGAAPEQDIVIVLDHSYSMGERRRWDAAIAAARERIEALGGGGRAALITFDDRAVVIRGLTSDRAALGAALDTLEPGRGGTRFAPALRLAAEVLAAGGAVDRRVVLLSDLQRVGLSGDDRPWLEESVGLEIVPIVTDSAPNAAVMDARLVTEHAAARSARSVLAVRVRNTGGRPYAGDAVLRIDGHEVGRHSLALAAGSERLLQFPLVLEPGIPAAASVTVDADSIAGDDGFDMVLAEPPALRVGLVGSASAAAGLFLDQALALMRSPPVTVSRLTPADLTRARLADVDLVILDDVAPPSGMAGDAVRQFVSAGGALMVVAGPSMEGWPAVAGSALPGGLGPAVPVSGAATIRPQAGHALWFSLGADPEAALSGARVSTARGLEPGAQDRVVAWLDTGAPLVLERRTGLGRALLFATTFDTRWSTLALEPAFVPLVGAALAYLTDREPPPAALTAGEIANLPTLAATRREAADWRAYLDQGGGAVIELPDGREARIAPGRALYLTSSVGVHQAHRADGTGAALSFAVNAGRTESQLEAMGADELAARVSRHPSPGAGSASAALPGEGGRASGRDLWWYLLCLAGLTLIGESLLANRLSRSFPREPAAA